MSSQSMYSHGDVVILEDESARIRLVGQPLLDAGLVTGVTLGVLGTEMNGQFDVLELCFSGMAPQVVWECNEENQHGMIADGEWV